MSNAMTENNQRNAVDRVLKTFWLVVRLSSYSDFIHVLGMYKIKKRCYSNRLGSNSKSSKSEVSTTSSIVISLYVRSKFIVAG